MFVVELEEPCFIIDTDTLSSKYLMLEVRKSVYALNDLLQNTPASPNNFVLHD